VEHEEPCNHVHEETLRREREQDDHEGRARDRLHLVGAEQHAEGEKCGEGVGEEAHARPRERDRRLPLLERGDDAGVLDALRVLPFAPVDDERRESAGRPADEPRQHEQREHDDEAPERRGQRSAVVEQVDERGHRGRRALRPTTLLSDEGRGAAAGIDAVADALTRRWTSRVA